MLDVVVDIHMPVAPARAPYLQPDTRSSLGDFIIGVHEGEHAEMSAHLVARGKSLTNPAFVIVQALCAGDRIVLQKVVGAVAYEITLCVGETFGTFCAEWQGDAEFSHVFFFRQSGVYPINTILLIKTL